MTNVVGVKVVMSSDIINRPSPRPHLRMCCMYRTRGYYILLIPCQLLLYRRVRPHSLSTIYLLLRFRLKSDAAIHTSINTYDIDRCSYTHFVCTYLHTYNIPPCLRYILFTLLLAGEAISNDGSDNIARRQRSKRRLTWGANDCMI